MGNQCFVGDSKFGHYKPNWMKLNSHLAISLLHQIPPDILQSDELISTNNNDQTVKFIIAGTKNSGKTTIADLLNQLPLTDDNNVVGGGHGAFLRSIFKRHATKRIDLAPHDNNTDDNSNNNSYVTPIFKAIEMNNIMEDMIGESCAGVIFVVNASKYDDEIEMAESFKQLEELSMIFAGHPFIIAFNKEEEMKPSSSSSMDLETVKKNLLKEFCDCEELKKSIVYGIFTNAIQSKVAITQFDPLCKCIYIMEALRSCGFM